jgi:hypothetical protein
MPFISGIPSFALEGDSTYKEHLALPFIWDWKEPGVMPPPPAPAMILRATIRTWRFRLPFIELYSTVF